MDHFYKDIEGWFTWPRFYRDIVRKFPSGSSFVEIGVFKGMSLAYLIVEMINAEKKFNIYGIDSFQQFALDETTFVGSSVDIVNENLISVKDKYKIIVGDSSNIANYFKDKSFDFAFIDGGHAYKSVRKDILAWMPKVKIGGILAGHDYPGFPGVKQAVDELLGSHVDKRYVINELCWFIKIK